MADNNSGLPQSSRLAEYTARNGKPNATTAAAQKSRKAGTTPPSGQKTSATSKGCSCS